MYDINKLEEPVLEDILLNYGLAFDNYYEFNEVGVPRVSHILEACRDQSNLITWAAGIPEYLYNNIRNKALTVGTEVHHKIENYLRYIFGQSDVEDIINLEDQKDSYQEEIDIAYGNFKNWVLNCKSKGINFEELVGLEIPVICPWYGGTIDCIMKINGCYYIIDFKTSKSISYSYLMQSAAYMWIINNGYTKLPHIDGVGIIRVDKKNTFSGFEDLFLNVYNPYQNYMINQFQMTFCSYVDSYYRTLHTDNLISEYKSSYDIKNLEVSKCKTKKVS